MSVLYIRVPAQAAESLSKIKVPGDKELVGDLHITLVYFGDVAMEDVAKTVVELEKVTSQTKPFKVSTKRLTTFPEGDDGIPVICKVESDTLQDFRAKVAKQLDTAGIDFSKKHPEYRPHITLSYAHGKAVEDRDIKPVEWEVREVVLGVGTLEEPTVFVTFTLGAQNLRMKAAADLVARVRAA